MASLKDQSSTSTYLKYDQSEIRLQLRHHRRTYP